MVPTVSSRVAAWTTGTLLVIVLVLATLSFLTYAHAYSSYDGFPFNIVSSLDTAEPGVPWLGIDQEQSVPAWFSSSMLLLCALVLSAIATSPDSRPRFRRHWLVLAAIFVLLSIDEAVGFHERTIRPIREALGTGELLYYAWVIPGALLVLAVGLAYSRFLRALPTRTRILFVVAAALYVGGALVVESTGGNHAESFGQENLAYIALSTLEELLEMLGVVVFLYALMSYRGPQAVQAEHSQEAVSP